MRYRILRVNERGLRVPVARAGTFADVETATDLCQELNDLAAKHHTGCEYVVETVEVVPARRLFP